MSDKPLILQAFEGTNRTVPVWFMRQAGRYLPDYQKLKSKYSLNEMFNTPELAAEVTCQPLSILNVDAAILFADILTLPQAMGFDITFDNKKGPIVNQKFELSQIRQIQDIPHVSQTIRIILDRLPANIPLIGFAGSPFTVLTYLIEGGSSQTFKNTFKLMHHDPERFHELMTALTKSTIQYVQIQKQAGISIFQLFDSWAGILRPIDYANMVLPYVQKIFEQVDIPSIYFLKNTHHLLPLMDRCDADFLSVDHTVILGHERVIDKTKKGIQGNLFNGLLYSAPDILKQEVNDVLVGGQKHGRYIFNLSHGIFPDVQVDQLKRVVDQVHNFDWKA